VNVAALIRAFTTYGPILDMEVYDRGYRASILFTNHADALAFVEEMTFSTHGPLFIPGIPYGQRLGAWIRNRRQRVSNNIVSMFFNFIIIFLLRELMQEPKEGVVLGILAGLVTAVVSGMVGGMVAGLVAGQGRGRNLGRGRGVGEVVEEEREA
jgi:hypothetical protein